MRLNHVTLPCADVARALAFYRALGLEAIVLDENPDGALRYARLRAPDGDSTLSLELAPGSEAAGGDGGGAILFFECDDLDARLQALVAAGHVLASPVETKPWMWREAELRDPDGRRVRLYHAGSYRLDPPWRLPGTRGATEPAAGATGDDRTTSFLSAHNRGYAEGPIPNARDEELAAHLETLAAAAPAAREAAADLFGGAYTSTLLAFAERMATHAARDGRERPALLGLLAVGLAWRRAPDVRAAIPLLGVLHDAAARVGGGDAAARAFEQAAALAPDDVAPVFRDFLTRDLDGIAEEMGFTAGRDRDGFRYRRLWGAGMVEQG